MGGGGLAERKAESGELRRRSRLFYFNPFTESFVAGGRGFAPVRQQVMLAEDLEHLPQFFCCSGDSVLVGRRPSEAFLSGLERAGFLVPGFVELSELEVTGEDLRVLGEFCPWGWGPDSVGVYELLLARRLEGGREAGACFNEAIGRLYSKVWSAEFLRRIIGGGECGGLGGWCCGLDEVGVGVRSVTEALEVVGAIRGRGHHRVVVKEEYGMAGQGLVRLWEEELLPVQVRWMERALAGGHGLVVEPWLERECDFSVQLEMGGGGLGVCGCTGLLNDHRGQFMASWVGGAGGEGLPEGVGRLMESSMGWVPLLGDFYGVVLRELELELGRVGFLGPVGIDAFIYRGAGGVMRVKPMVEMNPRYTMGRVMLELRKRFAAGSCGVFRLVKLAQVRAAGFADFGGYARWLVERHPLRVEGGGGIVEGVVCLNDPGRARVCLAVLEVGRGGEVSRLLGGV